MSRAALSIFCALMGVTGIGSTHAAQEVYTGTARSKDGSLYYTEKHEVNLDSSGLVQSAKTDYFLPSGELAATLSSDFSKSLTAPDHVFKDFQKAGETYGIRNEGASVVLFTKELADKSERTKSFERTLGGDSLVVGCQGLHYYLKENLEKLQVGQSVPLKFLIPGKLDYFSFNMEVLSKKDGVVTLSLTASSIFVRLFAPKLTVQYEISSRRLLRYEGSSNLTDKNGKAQDVVITYQYR